MKKRKGPAPVPLLDAADILKEVIYGWPPTMWEQVRMIVRQTCVVAERQLAEDHGLGKCRPVTLAAIFNDNMSKPPSVAPRLPQRLSRFVTGADTLSKKKRRG